MWLYLCVCVLIGRLWESVSGLITHDVVSRLTGTLCGGLSPVCTSCVCVLHHHSAPVFVKPDLPRPPLGSRAQTGDSLVLMLGRLTFEPQPTF